MDSLEIDDSDPIQNKNIGQDTDYFIVQNISNDFILHDKKKKRHFPYLIYPTFLTFIILIISIIIYLVFISQYEITYIYVEDAYIKPKYSSHNYSTITFENGLKLVLIQVDPDDKGGGAIAFDYGYLDNKFEPGYLELAFLSLINNNIYNSSDLTNYFGTFNCKVEKYYSSFYFQILGGGFKSYLKAFSELTYFKDNDERFNNIGNNNFNFDNKDEGIEHLLEYLIYGYKDSKGEDIIPMNYKDIINDLNGNYTSIKNIMEFILSDPSKIKLVIYSHYKMSLMKKMFLNYFNEAINRPKKNYNNKIQNNIYNISEFSTNKIIYYQIDDYYNFIEIDYFLSNENITYEHLVKDSSYLLYIIYILNQTNEGSLYYKLNNINNDSSIKSLSSMYEIILKRKIKFSILIYLNHYSYKYISEIIPIVYNYMNIIKLYINNLNEHLNDIRIKELEIISEQIFTFTEDAHEEIFFKNMATDLFFKDDKNYLLKQIWFSKQNFINNINNVQEYFNQLNINNSVLIIGINNEAKNKYKLLESNISFVFNNTLETKYYKLQYSLNEIVKHFNITYDNNFTILLNPVENEFISKYNYNSNLNYDPNDIENYFETSFEEISNKSDNYLKVFWEKDTSFHIPKTYISIYFFHPFFRPNFIKESNINNSINKNDKLFFEFFLYVMYIERTIIEKLADAFRAGGNFFTIAFIENFIHLDLFIFSDKVQKILNVIKQIIYDKTTFISELEKRFEIYRDEVNLILGFCIYPTFVKNLFYTAITKDNNDKIPPLYNYCIFPKDAFKNILFKDLEDINEIKADIYSIKYIHIFGYCNKTEAIDIYKLFNSTNNFNIPLKMYANYEGTRINDSNFVDWMIEKKIIMNTFNFTYHTYYSYTTRFINIGEYTLKISCLIDMLIDILNNNELFNKYILSIISIKQTNIYLGFIFKNEIISHSLFLKNIKDWLQKNVKMKEKVDVIGDKFYYFLKGFKKIKSIKHYNMVDSAISAVLNNIYKTNIDNNILELNLDSYDIFIEEIEKLINRNINYIEIIT